MSKWGGSRATAIRQYYAPSVARGVVRCWRCHELIRPDDEWDVGHVQGRDAGGAVFDIHNTWPEHRGKCNRRDGANITNEKRSRRSRRLR